MARIDDDQIAALRPDALTPAQIAAKAVAVGEGKAALAYPKAFALAMLAGVFIGFGAMFMLIVKADSTLSFAASQLLSGLVFSVGLFLVVTAGAELFTGNSLMAAGLLKKRYGLPKLLLAWLVVYAGNLAGSLLLAWMLHMAGVSGMDAGAVGEAAAKIASSKASLAPATAFFRGVLCNMLVCLAVWMSFAARTVIDKLATCIMPVMAFVACGYEHSIANMFFLPFGILCGSDAALTGVLSNIFFVTLGNIVGGAVLIACSYWFAYLRD